MKRLKLGQSECKKQPIVRERAEIELYHYRCSRWKHSVLQLDEIVKEPETNE
jgi:hypothetical protein